MQKLNKLYLGTNTKMYKTISQTKEFLIELHELTKDIPRDKLELFVIPSFTTLDQAGKCIPRGFIRLGGQNMGWEEEGQFSGEISPIMLKEVGVETVMIGHSERRFVLGETNEMENKRVLCALRNDLIPLLCIGETSFDRDHGISDEVLSTQLKVGLHGVSIENAAKVRVAYEPLWAIGVNGIPAKADYVEMRHRNIRNVLIELFGDETGRKIPVLYGGSVNNGNAQELIAINGVDGLFIGRSAWQAENFNKIIRSVIQIWDKKM